MGLRPFLMLGLLAFAELLGMSMWFTASAVSPQLREIWTLGETQTGWLTTIVQLGFVAGTAIAALANLADLYSSRWYFVVCALLAAASNAALLIVPDFELALVARFATGFFLAGVYPPAMKMVATWFAPAARGAATQRGLAIGTVVGALTVGKALPYLLRSFEGLTHRNVIGSASIAAVLAALLVALLYRDGPQAFARRPFSWNLVGAVLEHRPTRLAIAGYLGHMWELYAMWTLVAAFFFDFYRERGAGLLEAGSLSGLIAFAAIAAGGLGSILAGVWADRFGRERITICSMAVSGACALLIGWLTMLPPFFLVALAMVWGFAIVADSAQFSALVTELAPAHSVGTALTLQTSLGFLLTAGSIWLAVEISGRFGWGPAFTLLAIGPALGIVAMRRLERVRS